MNGKTARVALALALALAAVACAGTPGDPVVVTGGSLDPERTSPMIGTGEDVPEPELLDPNRVLGRVNDQIITVRSIRAEFGTAVMPDVLGVSDEAQVRQLLDRFTLRLIADRLFLEAAERMGVVVTKEDMVRIREQFDKEARERGTTFEKDLAERGVPEWEWEAEFRRKLLRERYVQMALGQAQPMNPETRALFDTYVRPSEVRAFYDRHPENYREVESAKLAGLYVRDAEFDGDEGRSEARARSLVARARRGEDFAKLVEEVQGDSPLTYFDEPFDRAGGEAKFGPDVSAFAWSAAVGSVGEPIRRASGWLVLRLERRQEARQVPFREVKERIEEHIYGLRLNIGRLKLQLDLLEESVVDPRRFKNAIRTGLREEIARNLDELTG